MSYYMMIIGDRGEMVKCNTCSKKIRKSAVYFQRFGDLLLPRCKKCSDKEEQEERQSSKNGY